MVDLVQQLRDSAEKNAHYDTLRTNVLWAADEIERLRKKLAKRETKDPADFV